MYSKLSKSAIESYLDIQSLRHQHILRDNSTWKCRHRSRNARFVHKANVRIRCSRHSPSFWRRHQIRLGSRSDDRPQDLCKWRLAHKRRDVHTRRCRRTHRKGSPRIPVYSHTYSFQDNSDTARWCRTIPAEHTRRCPSSALLHRPRSLAYTCKRSSPEGYSTLRFQRIFQLSMDRDTRRCLKNVFVVDIQGFLNNFQLPSQCRPSPT